MKKAAFTIYVIFLHVVCVRVCDFIFGTGTMPVDNLTKPGNVANPGKAIRGKDWCSKSMPNEVSPNEVRKMKFCLIIKVSQKKKESST